MEGKGSLFESWVSGTEAWFQAMFRTGFGRSGEGATGPDSGTWKGARNGAFCKGWESFLERFFFGTERRVSVCPASGEAERGGRKCEDGR